MLEKECTLEFHAVDDEAGDADFQLSDCELPGQRAHGGVSWFENQRGANQLHVQARGIQTPSTGVDNAHVLMKVQYLRSIS